VMPTLDVGNRVLDLLPHAQNARRRSVDTAEAVTRPPRRSRLRPPRTILVFLTQNLPDGLSAESISETNAPLPIVHSLYIRLYLGSEKGPISLSDQQCSASTLSASTR
jgi:hypothetical protein